MPTPPAFESSQYSDYKSAVYNGGTVDGLDKATKDLFVAAVTSSLEGIDDAMKRGAKIDAKDSYGKTPIHYAADTIVEFEDGQIYKALLDKLKSHGANMTASDNNRQTPIGQFMQGYRAELEYPDMKNPERVLADGLAAWKAVGVDTSRYEPQSTRGASRG